MSRHSELGARLMRNRQRLSVERLTTLAQPFLSRALAVVDAVESIDLAPELRSQLKLRRPRAAGNLLVTENGSTFAATVEKYFSDRAGRTFHAFLAHWGDAGALILDGSDLAKHGVPLLRLDGDTLYGCTSDRTEGFALDLTVTGAGVIFVLFSFQC
jgi:hypothetical protein